MPKSMVRLSAGREQMSDELQALCFLGGANSILYGEKLFTTGNPDTERDLALFDRLGLRPMQLVDTPHTQGGNHEHSENIETHLTSPEPHSRNRPAGNSGSRSRKSPRKPQ